MGDEPSSMTPAPSEQSVFAEAILLPTPEARAAFLAAACGSDVALRQRVEALLQAADQAGDFLEAPPTGLSGGTDSTLSVTEFSEKPGDNIGRYKLLQQIGEGGCGVVYMAEQLEPVRRRVALKVIKLGMDTKSVIARFEAERQALALMDHPNIAKVLDAGATETGRPYFVMELVRGIKITDYCDQNNLATDERLKLFTQVCHAIQHAHQKGIIHRDIKPSNILVTRDEAVAVPKVIDFGIAKATTDQRLTDKTVFTAFEQFLGTPAYMSPEQAMMTSLDIDTRTDIYALGVLLYELLTGTTPFDAGELMAAGLDGMRRTIREQEPARPSTRLSTMLEADLTTVASHRHSDPAKLGSLLRGDLDWIVMKALEKDRTRRYETANGLAMDIQRHLSNEPVTARPPSHLYEFQKTVRRHKFGFAAATALILVLGLGVLASSWQALRATRAERAQIKLRQESETEATKSRQAAQFMQDMLKGVGPAAALGRDTAMLRDILDKTAGRIANDLQAQPDVEAELRSTIGNVYWELGDWEKSSAMHSQALAIRRKLFGNEHRSVAVSLHGLAEALRHQLRHAEAEAAFRESLAIRRKLLGKEHPDVAQSLNYLASLLSIELKNNEPETLLREAIAIRRKVLGNEHGDVGTSLDNLAHVLNRQGKAAEAIAMHYEALAIRKKFFGDQHPELVYSYRNLAGALEGQGQLAEAEAMLRTAMALCDKLLGQRHPDLSQVRYDLARVLQSQGKQQAAEALQNESDMSLPRLAVALHDSARHLQQLGKTAEAETVCREALAVRRKSRSNESPELVLTLNLLWELLVAQGKATELEALLRDRPGAETAATEEAQLQLGHRLWQIGDAYSQREQLADAGRNYDRALQQFRQLQVQFPTNAYYRQEQAFSHRHLSNVMERSGRLDEAEAHNRSAGDIYEQLANEVPTSTFYPQEAAFTRRRSVEIFCTQGKFDQAEALSRRELALARMKFGEVHREVDSTLASLGRVLRRSGKLVEAEVVAREELALEKRLSGDAHPFVANSLLELGRVFYGQRRPAEAEAVFREALALRRKLAADDSAAIALALAWLATTLEDQGKLAGVEICYRELLSHKRKLYGNEHLDVGSALAQLTTTLLAQNKFTDAEPMARECLAIRERKMADGWQTFNARSLLGGSLLGQKKYAEAEPLLLDGYAGMKQREAKIPDVGKPRLIDAVQRLVQLYEQTDRPTQLAEWKQQLAAFHQAAAKDIAPPKP